MKWQPIETAPRDGTRVFVYRPDARSRARSFGVDFWHQGNWWHTRPAEPPALWMDVEDMRQSAEKAHARELEA